MTGEEIIEKFHVQTDDSTELSSDEELDLLNDVYLEICAERAWEILKTSATGTIVNNEITLPSDFAFLYPNRDFAGNTTEAHLPVIFIGSNYTPVQIVNFDARRQYRNSKNVAYLDIANNKLVFQMTPAFDTYEFDYIKIPPVLTTATSPVFPSRFHKRIAYEMATQDAIIQMSDKVQLMYDVNMREADRYKSNMEYWDSKQQLI